MNINDFQTYPDTSGSYALNQVPKFSLETQHKCKVQIKIGTYVLFTGSYRPDPSSDMIFADFKDIYKEKVETQLRNASLK